MGRFKDPEICKIIEKLKAAGELYLYLTNQI